MDHPSLDSCVSVCRHIHASMCVFRVGMCVCISMCLSAYVYLCLCDCVSVICCVYMWINSKKPESVSLKGQRQTHFTAKKSPRTCCFDHCFPSAFQEAWGCIRSTAINQPHFLESPRHHVTPVPPSPSHKCESSSARSRLATGRERHSEGRIPPHS